MAGSWGPPFLHLYITHNLYYVNSTQHRNNVSKEREIFNGQPEDRKEPNDICRDNCGPVQSLHSITSLEQEKAVELIRWVFGVAGIPADSPRFAYYVSRWRVPEKIEAARTAGTLAASLKKSPPIDPSWIRLVPAALEEYLRFVQPIQKAERPAFLSSGTRRPAGNRKRRAA